MGKKIIVASLILLVSFGASIGYVGAQTTSTIPVPTAGLTPLSPLYFLNQWSEAVQRFFTFGQEARVKLELVLAAERIAELRTVLENKGFSDPNVQTLEQNIHTSIKYATGVLDTKKSAGEDVSSLAKIVNNGVKENNEFLKETLKLHSESLFQEMDSLLSDLKEAERMSDNAKIAEITKEINSLQQVKNELDKNEKENEKELEKAHKDARDAMDAQEGADDIISETVGDVEEMLTEAKKEGITLDADAVASAEALIEAIRTAYASGQYDVAKKKSELLYTLKKSLKTQFESQKEFKDSEKENNQMEKEGINEKSLKNREEEIKNDLENIREQEKDLNENN